MIRSRGRIPENTPSVKEVASPSCYNHGVKGAKKRTSVRRKTSKGFFGKIGKTLKDHLFPHKGNKHLPHALRHKALFGYSVLLILLKGAVIGASIALPAASLFSSAITAPNIVALTNQTRENLGLGDLSVNNELSASASMKAEDMLANQYFAHTSPAGVTPWSWFAKNGYTYTYAGENLAVYFTSAEDVYSGWLASPTHKANIIDPRYNEIGVGVAQGEYQGYPAIFVVQHFGYPKNADALKEPSKPKGADVLTDLAIAPEVPIPQITETAVLGVESESVPSIITEGSVVVTPNKDSYTLSLKADDTTTAVTARLGTESAPLAKKDGAWQGDLAFNAASLSDNGEQLYITAQSKNTQITEPVALAAPETNTQSLYGFAAPKGEYKLFGIFSVSGMEDSVRQFTILSIIALCTILLMTLIAKFNSTRIPVMTHAVAVIALALVLTIL